MTSLAFFALSASFAPDRSSQAELLSMVNSYRAAHGVEEIRLDDRLCQVADGHALFMSTNNTLTHYQRSDWPSFTGNDLAARAAKISWKDELSELVGYANTSVSDSVQAIFDSPCHRSRFLRPGSLTLGASAQGQYVCLLFGGESVRKNVLSPANGAINVPTTWQGAIDFSGTKTGFGSNRFGYPVLFISGGSSIDVQDAKLTDTEGNTVQTVLRDPSNDHHYSDAFTLIPSKPLKPSTTYRVSLKAKLGREDVSVEWSFTTK